MTSPAVPLVLALTACAGVPSTAPVVEASASPARTVGAGCGGAYGTIQDAIDASTDGDVIVVCAGVYSEQLLVSGKSITLRGRRGATMPVIDAGSTGRALTIESGADVRVDRLVFRNGDSSGTGGNVSCRDSTVAILRSTFESGHAYQGGGFGAVDCTGRIQRSTFTTNHADVYGGGLFAEDGVDVIGNVFRDNTSDKGAGALVRDSFSEISGNTFVGNESVDDGGGCYVLYGAPLVDGNTFEDNLAGDEAGGLRVKGAEAVITNNVLSANHASYRGGAMKVSHDEVVMADNTYVGNTATWWAGAVLLFESASLLQRETYVDNESDSGGAMVILPGWGSVTIEDSVFEGNHADDDGGHLYIDLPGYDTKLRRVTLAGGTADLGAGVYARSGVRVQNTLLEGNVATVGGGGLYLYGVTGDVENSVLVDNDAPLGAGVRVYAGVAGLSLANTIFDGNTGAPALEVSSTSVAPDVAYSDFFGNDSDFGGMPDLVGTSGNVALDPLYVAAGNGDYSLAAGSPLIDLGDPAITDPDGTRSDIGLSGGPHAAP